MYQSEPLSTVVNDMSKKIKKKLYYFINLCFLFKI